MAEGLKITKEERKFLKIYKEQGKLDEASRAIGLTRTQGFALLQKDHIKELLKDFARRAKKDLGISFEGVAGQLKDLAEDPETPVRDKIKALHHICLLYGFYAAEKRITTNLNIDMDLIKVKETYLKVLEENKREY